LTLLEFYQTVNIFVSELECGKKAIEMAIDQ